MEEIKIIKGGIAVDDRGSLRFVNDFKFANVKRFYQVENHRQGFIRAFHGHLLEGKYVYVASGSALVAAVPLVRSDDMNVPGGDYYIKEKPKKFVLSAKIPGILYIPPGYANGFKNLEDNTIIIFFSTTTLEESKGDDIRFPYDVGDVYDKNSFWEEDFR